MGKSSRQSNLDERARRDSERLLMLTDVIGELFGPRNECVEACALFEASAERLGLSVKARAVSILAVTEAGNLISTGLEGARQGKLAGAAVSKDAAVWTLGEGDFDRAGHMVITSIRPTMILDPTFRQFSRMGGPDTVIGGNVASIDPQHGRITLSLPAPVAGEVTYFFDDANTGWQEGYAHAKRDWSGGGVAEAVASHVAGGGWGDSLGFEIPWSDHPGH